MSASGDGPEAWVEDVLAFWFGELTPAQWFKRSDAVDAEIGRRFGDLLVRVATDAEVDPDTAAVEPMAAHERLARIIVLDQFPRNVFRGTPRAFATDRWALALARQTVELGFDLAFPAQQRLFVYLPFEHSEDATDQMTSVRLIAALGDAELTRFALRHQEIIIRFGRFPHRNAILARDSTPEEIAFLGEPDSGF